MDFTALWIIVISYIDSVGLLLFSTFGPTSGWLLVWILLFTGSALAPDIPVAYSANWSAFGVLGRAGGSARYMGFCAIPTRMLVLGIWCFLLLLLWVRLRSLGLFLTRLTVLDPRPCTALMLSGMVMQVLHVSSILTVVALRSRANNFLTTSLSVRAWTRWNWTFCSFSLSIGKLRLLTNALRWSTSSSGVSPGLTCTSSNWYIQHCSDTVWSIWDAKWSRKDFMLFLVAAISSVATPASVHWFHIWWPVVSRKFSIYSRQAPLSSDIAWRQNQLSMDLPKSLNSSYWSDVVHSKVDVFNLVAGWLGISNLRAVVRAARGSAAVPAGSFGWVITAGIEEGYK